MSKWCWFLTHTLTDNNNNIINNRKIKTFRIPMAPVPSDLRQAISKRLVREQWNPPEQARMRFQPVLQAVAM